MLFDQFCERLVVAGVPLWRGFAGMRTLHPQWDGYSYTWRRDLNAVEPVQFERGDEYEHSLANSPFGYLIQQVENSGREGDPWQYLRRRLGGPEAKLDFPILKDLAAAGASDYFATIVRFGASASGDPSHGTGIGYSFSTDRYGGFSNEDLVLLRAVLPAVSLAIMTHAGHRIASGLLEAYLGGDAGGRVHAGAVERGSVESLRAVVWYADIRGFTAIAETTPWACGHRANQRDFRNAYCFLAPSGRPGAEIPRRRDAGDLSLRGCDAGRDLQPGYGCRCRRDEGSRWA
jgi:adenylate cyclase